MESPASTIAPPDYLTILTNPSGSGTNATAASTATSSGSSPESIEIGQRPGGYAQRSQSLGRKLQRSTTATATPSLGEQQQRPYTAEDVVTILRSSVRHRPPPRQNVATTLPRPPVRMSTHLEDASFRSIENLVLNAEPPDQTPGVGSETNHSDSNSNSNSDNNSNSNNTSVI